MSNYDLTAGTVTKLYQAHDQGWGTLTNQVDFSKFTGTAAGVAADTADVITIPAGFVVEDVYAIIVTASSTGSSVFGAGDQASSTFYLPNTTSATATAGTVVKTGAGAASAFKDITSVTTLANSMVKFYSAANTLRVVLGATAPLNGVVKFIVRGFQTI